MDLSVKFFKRLILGFFVLAYLVLLFLAIWFGISSRRLRAENTALQEQVEQLQMQGGWKPGEGDFEYQTLYPELYCEEPRPDGWVRSSNTVYLTFNNGPSEVTGQILDALAENGVKATFFVRGQTDEAAKEIMRRIVNEGHTIGVYTYSHRYTDIYKSVESYLDDFKLMYDLIYEATGVHPTVFRFAGGSISIYNALIYEPLIAEMTRRGFTYYDWNATGGDTISGATAESIKANVLQSMEGQDRAVVLLHDGAECVYTPEAVTAIITELRGQGYDFAALTPEIAPVIFGYDNVP